jgi:hypothetical protein
VSDERARERRLRLVAKRQGFSVITLKHRALGDASYVIVGDGTVSRHKLSLDGVESFLKADAEGQRDLLRDMDAEFAARHEEAKRAADELLALDKLEATKGKLGKLRRQRRLDLNKQMDPWLTFVEGVVRPALLH